jgi:biopolymer transport protein ExbB
MLQYLISAFSGPGAVFMYLIVALLAYALAVGIERGFLLGVSWRPGASVRAALEAGRLDDALKEAGDTPLGGVLAAGVGETDPEVAWEAMSAAAVHAEERVSRRVAGLNAVANLATMLGLLGTVYGLILAFSALGDSSAGERALKLSEGISTAMATTAFGLMVGIPALGLHAGLDGAVRTRVSELEASAGLVMLTLRRRGAQSDD